MRNTRRLLTLTFCVALVASGGARAQDPIDRIREADLKADLFTLAGDAMRGREGGTLDELTASMWVAERARAGRAAAGRRQRHVLPVLPARAVPRVGEQPGRRSAARRCAWAATSCPTTSCSPTSTRRSSSPTPTRSPASTSTGKALVVRYAPPPTPAAAAQSVESERASGAAHLAPRHPAQRSRRRIPAAIVAIVPDESTGSVGPHRRTRFRAARTRSIPDGTADPRVPTRGVPLLYVRESALGGAARRRRAAGRVDLHRQLPVPVGQHHREGARPRSELASEYVLYSAHQDHDGVRYPVERRRHLERRRRQRVDRGRAARDRPRGRRVAAAAARRCSSGTAPKSAG